MNTSHLKTLATALSFAALLAVANSAVAAGYVDNIFFPQPNGPAWQTQSTATGLNNPTDIESFDNANEFVVTSADGVRNYFFNVNTLDYVQMTTQADYTSIADIGNASATYVAVGASNRIDRIRAPVNDWETNTILPANTLTGTVRVESYDNFGLFVTLSNEGVRFYQTDGVFGGQISDRTDYVAIADNAFGANNETFFALAADGSVDRIQFDNATAPYLYSTTSILPAGTIFDPRDIESYDGNNEFVTVGGAGVREYFFSGGNWVFDQMSLSSEYFAIADNGGAPADYFALGAAVPEPSALALLACGSICLLLRRRRR